MRKLLTILVLGVSGGLALGLPALDVQAKGSDTLSMQLSRIVLSEELYAATVTQMTQGMIQSARASGSELPPDLATKLQVVVKEALPHQELLQFNAQVYANHFNDKELTDILAFYKTPTGSKMVRELPGITQEVAQKVGTLLPQRLPELMKKHGLGP
jgi:uncharacterized protein